MIGHEAYRSGRPETGSINLIEAAAILMRYWRVCIAVPTVLVVVVVLYLALSPPSYTAVASFMPQNAGMSLSGLGGLAAQYGLVSPGGKPGQSPEFYGDLLVSDALLREVLSTNIALGKAGDSITVVEWYYPDKDVPSVGLKDAIERLRDHVAVAVRIPTGVVTMKVTARDPIIAAGIADAALFHLNRFDLEVRQSQSALETDFLHARLTEARDSLRSAEDELQEFLQDNREFRQSPQLSFDHDRLQRVVGMRQQLVTGLIEAYEKARANEVRDTPVITVIQHPLPPTEPDSKEWLLRIVLAGFVGSAFGVLGALLVEFIRRTSRISPSETAALLASGQRIVRKLQKLFAWNRRYGE